ncbi:MAG: hypothetical protein NTU81_01960 [Candidatus Nomurabacteria bacterium]|nr:hypothetical protein [Candidatus Nomurabacteria bacterium]
MDTKVDLLKIQIEEARALLSKESREAIDSVNWKLVILEMNKKYSPEQLDDLSTETELLLCGILKPEEYQKEIQSRMRITNDDTNILLGELDRLIFKKIAEELKKKLERTAKTVFEKKPLILDPRFITMPKDIQEAIAGSDWKNKLYEISKKYKLNIEQMGIIEDITVKVIQNVIHSDKYEGEIISKIPLPKEEISDLIKDVNENIFINIREVMKKNEQEKINGSDMKVESEDKVPVPPYAKSSIELPAVQTTIPKIEEVIEIKKPTESVAQSASIIKKEDRLDYIEHITTKIETPVKIKDELKDAWEVKPSIPIPKSPIVNTQAISMGDKLKSITMSDHTVSDYSIPKISTPSPLPSNTVSSPKSHDPYREEF